MTCECEYVMITNKHVYSLRTNPLDWELGILLRQGYKGCFYCVEFETQINV